MSDSLGREPRRLIPALDSFYTFSIPFSWLLVRCGAGALLAVHGWGKIGSTRGPERTDAGLPELASIGAEITFVLMIIELVGGICIALGLFTRFFAAAAAVEMAVADLLHLLGQRLQLDGARLRIHAAVGHCPARHRPARRRPVLARPEDRPGALTCAAALVSAQLLLFYRPQQPGRRSAARLQED